MRADGDRDHLLDHALFLHADGLFHGDLAERVHRHFHVGQIDARLVGFDPRLDVVIDRPLDRDQDLHRLHHFRTRHWAIAPCARDAKPRARGWPGATRLLEGRVMARWFTAAQLTALALFVAAVATAVAYEMIFVWPAQRCEAGGDWWDGRDLQASRPYRSPASQGQGLRFGPAEAPEAQRVAPGVQRTSPAALGRWRSARRRTAGRRAGSGSATPRLLTGSPASTGARPRVRRAGRRCAPGAGPPAAGVPARQDEGGRAASSALRASISPSSRATWVARMRRVGRPLAGLGRRRQIRAQVEEIVLDAGQDRIERGVRGGVKPRQADDGVGLVHRAIGLDPQARPC